MLLPHPHLPLSHSQCDNDNTMINAVGVVMLSVSSAGCVGVVRDLVTDGPGAFWGDIGSVQVGWMILQVMSKYFWFYIAYSTLGLHSYSMCPTPYHIWYANSRSPHKLVGINQTRPFQLSILMCHHAVGHVHRFSFLMWYYSSWSHTFQRWECEYPASQFVV